MSWGRISCIHSASFRANAGMRWNIGWLQFQAHSPQRYPVLNKRQVARMTDSYRCRETINWGSWTNKHVAWNHPAPTESAIPPGVGMGPWGVEGHPIHLSPVVDSGIDNNSVEGKWKTRVAKLQNNSTSLLIFMPANIICWDPLTGPKVLPGEIYRHLVFAAWSKWHVQNQKPKWTTCSQKLSASQ